MLVLIEDRPVLSEENFNEPEERTATNEHSCMTSEEFCQQAFQRLKQVENSVANRTVSTDRVKDLIDENLTPSQFTAIVSSTGGQIAERLESETFKQAASFFGLEVKDLFNSRFRSTLGGLFKIPLKVTQLYALFWVLRRRIMDKRTSVIADAPGWGKVGFPSLLSCQANLR